MKSRQRVSAWRFVPPLRHVRCAFGLMGALTSVRGALALQSEVRAGSRQNAAVGIVSATSIERPTLEIVLTALRAYEAGIPSMAWEQTMQQFRGADGSRERSVTTWSAEFAFARDGRWRSVVQQGTERDSLYFDKNWIYARGLKANARVVRAHETEPHHYLLTPLMLVTGGRDGGSVSPFMHMLSDELVHLHEVVVDDSAAPLIRVSGSRSRGDTWERLEATLDSERGYMPTSVVVTDEMWGVVRNEYRVTETERVGTSWVPREGSRRSTTLHPTELALGLAASPEGRQFEVELEAWKQASGLNLRMRTDRKRLAAHTIRLAGGTLFEGRPVAGVEQELLRSWNFRVLDDALATEIFKPPFDEGDRVYDSRTRHVCVWRDGKFENETATTAKGEKPAVQPSGQVPTAEKPSGDQR